MRWMLHIGTQDVSDQVEPGSVQGDQRAYARTGLLSFLVNDDDLTLDLTPEQEVIWRQDAASGAATTLAAAAAIGASNVKVASVAGLQSGDELRLGYGASRELVTVSVVGTAGAGGTGLTLSAPLTKAHLLGEEVVEQDRNFGGLLRNRVRAHVGHTLSRQHQISCQDFTTLLDDDVVDSGGVRSTSESDKARIEWLITTFGTKGISVGSTVVQLKATMPAAQDFTGMTLHQSLTEIAKVTWGSFYVDEYKRLQYLKDTGDAAPFGLSDTPDGVTTFGYSSFSLPEDTAELVNAVFVIGTGISGWRTDPASIATYGRRARPLRDETITTQAQLDAAGDAYLEGHSTPREGGTLVTDQPGLRAGMLVNVVNSGWGVNATYRIAGIVARLTGAGRAAFTVNFGDRAVDLADFIGATQEMLSSAVQVSQEAAAAVADLSVAGANMVPNSSFESASGGSWTVGAGWTFGHDPAAPQETFHGSKVARAVLAAATAADLVVTDFIPVAGSDDWWISFWSFMRAYTSGTARAELREYDAAGALLATTVIGDVAGAESEWTRHALHMGPNNQIGRTAWQPTTVKVKVAFRSVGAATLTWDVDGVQVERGKLLTAYAPRPQELVDGQIVGPEIANLAITTTKIADNAISTPKLQANAVEAAKIAAGAVETNKLAANAVTTGKLAAAAVTANELAAAAVTADKIATRALSVGLFSDDPVNLVPNGSFENIDGNSGFDNYDNTIPGWPNYTTALGIGALTLSAPKYGKVCLAFKQPASGTTYIIFTRNVPVRAGRRLRLHYWQRGSAVNSPTAAGYASIDWMDKDGAYLSTSSVAVYVNGASNTWVERAGTFVIPSNAAYARFMVRNMNTSATGDIVFFDQVEAYYLDDDVNHASGDVIIDDSGITVTNGKIVVNNPSGTVVIDGTSNMFKIVASGTISKTTADGTMRSVTDTVLSGLGAWSAIPICFAGVSFSNAATANRRQLSRDFWPYKAYGALTSGGAVTDPSVHLSYESSVGSALQATTNYAMVSFGMSVAIGDGSSVTAYARYQLCKEAAI